MERAERALEVKGREGVVEEGEVRAGHMGATEEARVLAA